MWCFPVHVFLGNCRTCHVVSKTACVRKRFMKTRNREIGCDFAASGDIKRSSDVLAHVRNARARAHDGQLY